MNKVIKHLLTKEDLAIGVGLVEQDRLDKVYELHKINASTLQGILVVKSKEDLDALDLTKLDTKVVLVSSTSTIYVYDTDKEVWNAKLDSIYTIDSFSNIYDTPSGIEVVFSKADKLLYIKNNDTWYASNSYLKVIETTSELESVQDGIDMVVVKNSGALYAKTGGKWSQLQIDGIGDPVAIVGSVDTLPTEPSIKLAIVTDTLRGGIFSYNEARKQDNDGGLIFNGWERQYSSAVFVEWYGAVGDGTTDSTEAFRKAVANNEIAIRSGTYKITEPVTITKSIFINGNNATLKFSGGGCLKFTGTTAMPIAITSDVAAGVTILSVNNQSLLDNQYLILKSGIADSYSKFGLYASQFVRISSKQGALAVNLYNPTEHYMKAASITPVNAISVNVRNLNIEGESQTAMIQLVNCCDSVVEDVRCISVNNVALEVNACASVKISKCLFNSSSTSVASVKILDSDNIICDNNIVYGANTGIAFEKGQGICNHIFLDKIMASSKGDAIACNGTTQGLQIHNCQTLGNLQLGGSLIKVSNSIITLHNKIAIEYFKGGLMSFKECVFYGNASATHTPFICWSEGGVFKKDATKVTLPPVYEFVNCNFISNTENYTCAAELLGIPTGTGISAAIPATILASNVNVGGTLTNFKATFSLYGVFDKLSFASVSLPAAAFKLVAATSASVIKELSLSVANVDCKYVFFDMPYSVKAFYGLPTADNKPEDIVADTWATLVSAARAVLVVPPLDKIFLDCKVAAINLDYSITAAYGSDTIVLTHALNGQSKIYTYSNDSSTASTTKDALIFCSRPFAAPAAKVNGGVI